MFYTVGESEIVAAEASATSESWASESRTSHSWSSHSWEGRSLLFVDVKQQLNQCATTLTPRAIVVGLERLHTEAWHPIHSLHEFERAGGDDARLSLAVGQ